MVSGCLHVDGSVDGASPASYSTSHVPADPGKAVSPSVAFFLSGRNSARNMTIKGLQEEVLFG